MALSTTVGTGTYTAEIRPYHQLLISSLPVQYIDLILEPEYKEYIVPASTADCPISPFTCTLFSGIVLEPEYKKDIVPASTADCPISPFTCTLFSGIVLELE
jgi:hypothetical protein